MVGGLGTSPYSTLYEIPVFNGLTPDKPKIIPVPLDFSVQQTYTVDLTLAQQLRQIQFIQSIIIDNTANGYPLTVQADQANLFIVCPPYSQICTPLFSSKLPVLTVSCAGGQKAVLAVANMKLPAYTTGPQSGVGSGNKLIASLIGDLAVSGNTSSTATLVTASATQGWYLKNIELFLSADATIAVAGETTIQVREGAANLFTVIVWLPAAALITTAGGVRILSMQNIQYNAKALNTSLNINITTVLATGKLSYNAVYGITNKIG